MSDLDKLILTKLKKFIRLCKHKRSSDGQWYFKEPSPKTINSVKSDKLLMALFTDTLKDPTLLERLYQKFNIDYDFQDFKTVSSKLLNIKNEKFFGFITGKENLIFPYGSYKGGIRNNKPHGKGVFNYFDGAYYVGNFINGKYDGSGKLIWPENNVMNFDGGYKTWEKSDFRKEQLINYKKYYNKMHGYGLFLKKYNFYLEYGYGGKFEGKWNNNQMIKGTMHQYNYSQIGNKYIGNFKNFMRNGLGEYMIPMDPFNDKTSKNTYGYTGSYKGNFKNNSFHGRGKVTDTIEMYDYLGDEIKRSKGDKVISIEDVIHKDGFRHIRSNVTIIYFNPKGIKKFVKYCEVLWNHKRDSYYDSRFVNKLDPKNVGRFLRKT